MKLFSFFIPLLLLFSPLSAVDIQSATIKATPHQAHLYQTITLTIQHPDISFIPVDLLQNHLLITGAHSEQAFTIIDHEQTKGKTLFFLEPLKPGSYKIGTRLFPIKKNTLLATTSTTVTILPAADDLVQNQNRLLPLPGTSSVSIDQSLWEEITKEENQTKKQRAEQIFSKKKIPWMVLLAAFLVFLTVWIAQKIWQQAKKRLSIISEDPKEKALAALEKLKKDNLPSKGFIEPFYIRLTAIIRLYVEESFAIHAPEQTTEEFLLSAEEHHLFDEQTKNHLARFMRKADLVKFARSTASRQECDDALLAAEDVLKPEL